MRGCSRSTVKPRTNALRLGSNIKARSKPGFGHVSLAWLLALRLIYFVNASGMGQTDISRSVTTTNVTANTTRHLAAAQTRAASGACRKLKIGQACSYWLDSVTKDTGTGVGLATELGELQASTFDTAIARGALVWGHCYELDVFQDGHSANHVALRGEVTPLAKAVFCLRDGSFELPDSLPANAFSHGINRTGVAALGSSSRLQSRVSEVVGWIAGGGWLILALSSPALCLLICCCGCFAARMLSEEHEDSTHLARLPAASLPVPSPAEQIQGSAKTLGASNKPDPRTGEGRSHRRDSRKPWKVVRATMGWRSSHRDHTPAATEPAYAPPTLAAAVAAMGSATPIVADDPIIAEKLTFGLYNDSVFNRFDVSLPVAPPRRGLKGLKKSFFMKRAALTAPGASPLESTHSNVPKAAVVGKSIVHGENTRSNPSASIGPSRSSSSSRPRPRPLEMNQNSGNYDIEAELRAAGFSSEDVPLPSGSPSNLTYSRPQNRAEISRSRNIVQQSPSASIEEPRSRPPKGTVEAVIDSEAPQRVVLQPQVPRGTATAASENKSSTVQPSSIVGEKLPTPLQLPKAAVPRLGAPPLPQSPLGSADGGSDGTCNSRSDLLTRIPSRQARARSRASKASTPEGVDDLGVGSEHHRSSSREGADEDYFVAAVDQERLNQAVASRPPRRKLSKALPASGEQHAQSHLNTTADAASNDSKGKWDKMEDDLRISVEEDMAARSSPLARLSPPTALGAISLPVARSSPKNASTKKKSRSSRNVTEK